MSGESKSSERKFRRVLTEDEKGRHRKIKGRYRRRKSTNMKARRPSAATKTAKSRRSSTVLEDALKELALSKSLDKEISLRREFSKYDTDGSGFIEASEVKEIFKTLGVDAESGQEGVFSAFWQEEMKRMDDDNDKLISFEEFVKYHNRIVDYEKRLDEINWALNHLTPHVDWGQSRVFKEVNFLADAVGHAALLDEAENVAQVREMLGKLLSEDDSLPQGPDQLMILVACMYLLLRGSDTGASPKADWARFSEIVSSSEVDVVDCILRLRKEGYSTLKHSQVVDAEAMLHSFAKTERLQGMMNEASLVPRTLLGALTMAIANAIKIGPPDEDEVRAQDKDVLFKNSYSVSKDGLRGVYMLRDAEAFDQHVEFVNQRLRGSRWRGVTLKVGWLNEGREGVLCLLFDTSKFDCQAAFEWWSCNGYEFDDGNVPGKIRIKLSGKRSAPKVEEAHEVEQKGAVDQALVKRCIAAAEKIEPEQISELVNMDAPPEYGESCMAATLILLGESSSIFEHGWNTMTKSIQSDPGALLERMKRRDLNAIASREARQLLRDVKKFYLNPDYNASTMRDAHPALNGLFRWCAEIKRCLHSIN